MIWIVAYFVVGVIAVLLNSRRHEKMSVVPSGIFAFDLWLFPIAIIFWPLVLILSNVDARIQIETVNERGNQREPEKIDISFLVGEIGETTTSQSPSGKSLVQGTEYETRSMLAFIPKGKMIRVVGHSMHHLQIEPADRDRTPHR
jgi:membrane-bound ClpP family serine protease